MSARLSGGLHLLFACHRAPFRVASPPDSSGYNLWPSALVPQLPAVSGRWEARTAWSQCTCWVGLSAPSVDSRLWQVGAFGTSQELFFMLLAHSGINRYYGIRFCQSLN